MPTITPRVEAANRLTAMFTPFELALAIVDAAAAGGVLEDWDSETVEDISASILHLTSLAGMPDWTNATDDSLSFWWTVAES